MNSNGEFQAKLIGESSDIRGEGNFPQGCAFSPDGLCVLTAIGSRLRLYNTLRADGDAIQEWKTSLDCQGGDSIRSYDWYPHMKSTEPSTCCFLATSR